MPHGESYSIRERGISAEVATTECAWVHDGPGSLLSKRSNASHSLFVSMKGLLTWRIRISSDRDKTGSASTMDLANATVLRRRVDRHVVLRSIFQPIFVGNIPCH